MKKIEIDYNKVRDGGTAIKSAFIKRELTDFIAFLKSMDTDDGAELLVYLHDSLGTNLIQVASATNSLIRNYGVEKGTVLYERGFKVGDKVKYTGTKDHMIGRPNLYVVEVYSDSYVVADNRVMVVAENTCFALPSELSLVE